jgi:toxin ParE1/3/4
MTGFLVLESAEEQIGEIYQYTMQTWGKGQADRYIRALYENFARLASSRALWQVIPKEYGVDGYFARYNRHRIYWTVLSTGEIGIRSVLHDSMDLPRHVRRDFSL